MFWIDSAIDIYIADHSVSIFHSFQILSFHDLSFDADLFGYRFRGIFLVAGDHDDSDSCSLAGRQCFIDFRSGRINHSHQPDENKIRGSSLVRESQDSERLSRHAYIFLDQLFFFLRGEFRYLIMNMDMGTHIQNHLR